MMLKARLADMTRLDAADSSNTNLFLDKHAKLLIREGPYASI
jgi:hypothetical protein